MDEKILANLTISEQINNDNFHTKEILEIDGKEQTVYILIPPILVVAAEELAKAFAARLGEKIAEEVFKNGLTGNNKAFEEEVTKQLAALNEKIEILINYIYTELPDLVRQQFSKEILHQKYIELETDLTIMRGAIATLEKAKKITIDDIDAARRASEQIAKTGEHLLRNGPEWHAAGLHSMSGLISIHARLGSIDKKYFAPLGVYANQYAHIIAPMLDPLNPKSAVAILDSLKAQFIYAENIIKDITNSSTFLFVIFDGYHEFTQPDGSVAYEKVWVGFKAWLSKDANGKWEGDWADSGAKVLKAPVPPEAFGWTVFEWLKEKDQIPTGHFDKDARWYYFGVAKNKVNEAQNATQILPAKIGELTNTINALQSLQMCCGKLKSLENIQKVN